MTPIYGLQCVRCKWLATFKALFFNCVDNLGQGGKRVELSAVLAIASFADRPLLAKDYRKHARRPMGTGAPLSSGRNAKCEIFEEPANRSWLFGRTLPMSLLPPALVWPAGG